MHISWKLKLTLLLVSSLTIMSVITISPALPQMARSFSNANALFLVKLVLTIPALMIAVVAPIAGKLIDRHGRLQLLHFSLVLYAVSGVAGFFLNNLYTILLSRAVLGIAVGISMTIVITLIADYFEGIERQKFVGIQIAFMSLGGIVFITVGGLLADVGWRYPFLLYLSSLAVLPLSLSFLREPQRTLQTVNNAPCKAPPFIWVLFLNTLVMWVLFFIIPVQIPFYLKSMGIEKSSLIGAAIASSTASSALSSISYARLKAHFNFLTVFSLGYVLLAAGFACIGLAANYLFVLTGTVLAGFGVGMMIPNTNMWVMKLAPAEIRGKEIGKLTTFWFFGQFLSPIVAFPFLELFTLDTMFIAASVVMLLLAGAYFLFNLSKPGKLVLQ